MKKAEISFRYAKWQVEQLKRDMDRAAMHGSKRIEFLRGQMFVWRDIMQAACEHDIQKVDGTDLKTGDEIFMHKCVKCEISEYDFGFETDFEINCYNCKHIVVESGDWVPYGSTNVQLPTSEYCNHPITEEMTEEQFGCFSRRNHKDCYYWEGR